ncbi:DUF2798 domain-containing protein [Cellvibrio sp. ARAG 10.3]|uniref:DUF2798 domain-containing protein n=1 Tax=Cellvibrio sp. ARAG 10.3 TaxID=3451358 RepID=UPI003F4898F4
MTQQSFSASRKLHPRFTSVVFAFYMSGIMAFLICMVVTAANRGFSDQYFLQVLNAYKLAMPVAFVCVMIVRPLVVKLVSWTVQQG